MARIRIRAKDLEAALAGRVLFMGGAREGYVIVQVPGEWPVRDYYLEARAARARGGEEVLEIVSARRDDAYGTYEVSPYAIAKWLRGLGLEPEVSAG